MTLVSASGVTLYKVLVAVPCGEMVHARFAQDLALMLSYTTYTRPEMEVHLALVQGTYLPRARAALVEHAMERQATHILWLDSDMRFPKDTLFRLLRHEKSVVAANYSTRQPPILPITTMEDGAHLFDHGLDVVEDCLLVQHTDVVRLQKRVDDQFPVGGVLDLYGAKVLQLLNAVEG